MWCNTDIIDTVSEILKESPSLFTGNQLIDEDHLRSKVIQILQNIIVSMYTNHPTNQYQSFIQIIFIEFTIDITHKKN